MLCIDMPFEPVVSDGDGRGTDYDIASSIRFMRKCAQR